ncbi:MAG TPA: hypothetical protein ENG83_10450 [Nitrospirae bacterium]|nr:hypothetical protein [Nitrospirota bacterium]HDZ00303.1 hypothetical protein [Nitrospirota bacterium]
MQQNQFYSFFDAEVLVYKFEEVLKKYQIEIYKNSELEGLCLNIIDIVEKHLKPKLRNPEIDIRSYFREFVGLQDLITKIIKFEKNEYFGQLIPHLKKLNDSNPLQSIKTSILNQENNKIFELFIATLCLNLNTEEIKVDDPDKSKGDNPDVIAKIDGKKWGLGCKAIHSSKPQSIFDNIETAITQIEKSESEIGIPVLTIKNIINHDKFWPILNDPEFNKGAHPIFGSFIDITVPFSMMNAFVMNLHQELINQIGLSQIKEIFKDKKSQPGCLLYCPTATSVRINNLPVTTRLNIFNIMTFDNISSECLSLMTNLNHQLQLT